MEVLPNKSKYAIQNLHLQGFSTFYPHIKTVRKYGNIIKNTFAPLFPRYIFIDTLLGIGEIRAVNSTYGVKGFVASDGKNPSSISLDVMKELLDRCDGEIIKSTALSKGDQVRFISGPLYGRLASVEGLDPQGRIMVLFQLLGADNVMLVDRAAIAPVVL